MTQQDGSIATLSLALSTLTVSDLKKRATLLARALPTRKAELIDVIVHRLDGQGLRTVWDSLDTTQRAAVAEVVHGRTSRFDAEVFRAKYRQEPNWGVRDKWGGYTTLSPLSLLFCGGVMPDDLKARLAAFVAPPRATRVETLAELPTVYRFPDAPPADQIPPGEEEYYEYPVQVHDTERCAQRELVSVLCLVDAGKVAVSAKTQRPSAATVKAISAILEGGDFYPELPVDDGWADENAGPVRAFAWPLILQAGKLAQLEGSKLRLTQPGRKALASPPAETLKTLWERWLDSPLLDELSRIERVKGQHRSGKSPLTALRPRRKAVATALAACPPGRWMSSDALIRFAQASRHDFSVARDPWSLYLGHPEYGSLGYGGDKMISERYFLAVLLEYAATLGLIDVALVPPAHARNDFGGLWGNDGAPFLSRYDGLMFLRINPLGAWCLGTAPTYEPAAVERRPVLQVLETLEIVAIAALDHADRLALDAWAPRTAESVWSLDAPSLLAAVDAGHSLEALRELLHARSDSALPITVSLLLDEVATRCTQLHDRGAARLIECADPLLAAYIAEDPRTRKHCMRAGERHLVVYATSEAAFKRGLRDLGYRVANAGNKG